VTVTLLDPLTLYCEHARGGLLAEPLNVLSNAAFFVAAWALWRDYRRTRTCIDEDRLTLAVLLALVAGQLLRRGHAAAATIARATAVLAAGLVLRAAAVSPSPKGLPRQF
jgi:hypothetical protein